MGSTMTFERGPHVNPFTGAGKDGIRLLESITPAQLASAVPRIIITKIDFKTGRPVEDVRPLMFDLAEPPRFDKTEFGLDRERFLERAVVSLQSLDVKSELQYGDNSLFQVNIRFIVHNPDIVFDRDTKVAWREILEEGKSFSLEYGWVADPTLCQNDLFNGFGHVTDQGIVVRSSQTLLLIVRKWTVQLRPTGEVEVNIMAMDNGDIALRETRFADAAGAVLAITGPPDPSGNGPKISDDDAARELFNRLNNVKATTTKRGKLIALGDLLDDIVAPMVTAAAKRFGYHGSPPVSFTLANFNQRAGRQSSAWGGRHMGGVTSIGDFLIPKDVLIEKFTKHLVKGQAMLLRFFINYILNTVNSSEAWDRVSGDQIRPLIGVRYDTIRTPNGISLSMIILDRHAIGDSVKRLKTIPLNRQTKAEIFKTLNDANVPIIEFSRAGSVILDASFEAQPDPLFQTIQIETSEKIRKDAVQKLQTPDTESRVGQARPRDIVPISSLAGDVTMLGNFVFGPYNQVWVEFFGASQISGIFSILEKTDRLEPGRFTSQFRLQSESIDPMNTRSRFSELELQKKGRGPLNPNRNG